MRRQIPMLLTAVVGFVYIIQFFIPHKPFDIFERLFTDWFLIIAACAIWLGVLNLLKLSLEKVHRRGKDWPYSVVTIAGFLLITIAGFFLSGGRQFQDPGTPFDYIYVNIFTPLSATMFALLAFFVASASYRAFRARTKEATLLLLAGFFVMLGRVPVGDFLTQWLPVGYRLSNLTDWIMNVPQTAGQRAIMIGIALGIMSTSLRVILGIERAITGGE